MSGIAPGIIGRMNEKDLYVTKDEVGKFDIAKGDPSVGWQVCLPYFKDFRSIGASVLFHGEVWCRCFKEKCVLHIFQ